MHALEEPKVLMPAAVDETTAEYLIIFRHRYFFMELVKNIQIP
jgi:hypothetical protein